MFIFTYIFIHICKNNYSKNILLQKRYKYHFFLKSVYLFLRHFFLKSVYLPQFSLRSGITGFANALILGERGLKFTPYVGEEEV